MATRRTALGRGLGALIPDAASSPRAAAPQPAEPDAAGIAVAQIAPNPQQPRRVFAEEDLRMLAESIRRHGVLQPVVVRHSSSDPDRYELVVGERRWRAAQLAGLERIPATVKELASRELLEVALVENVQRRDLNPIELALAFRTLLEGGATQEEVGARVGLDRSSVANHIRLLDLAREYQEDVEAARLSMGHAKALLQLPDPVRRRSLRDRILGEQLSVRAAEELARAATRSGAKPSARRSPTPERSDPNLAQLVDDLRNHLKTRVRITGDGRRGQIEIEFYGPEELHRLSQSLLDS